MKFLFASRNKLICLRSFGKSPKINFSPDFIDLVLPEIGISAPHLERRIRRSKTKANMTDSEIQRYLNPSLPFTPTELAVVAGGYLKQQPLGEKGMLMITTKSAFNIFQIQISSGEYLTAVLYWGYDKGGWHFDVVKFDSLKFSQDRYIFYRHPPFSEMKSFKPIIDPYHLDSNKWHSKEILEKISLLKEEVEALYKAVASK